MTRPKPTRLFHFTRVEHLRSIVQRGLSCDRRVKTSGLLSIEVGNPAIKALRASRPVLVEPGGVVADYVPFYFAPRSPMMYSIHSGNVPGYSGGTDRLIYLTTTLERLVRLGLDVVLTDRNAALAYAAFVRADDGEPNETFIDWPLMMQKMWNNTEDSPDRKERRMAECLVHQSVPWSAFEHIAARSPDVAREVERALGGASRPSVAVRPAWYF